MENVSSAINGIFYIETVTMETNRENNGARGGRNLSSSRID
jgi:hypothetical protein